ncbi:hypothetical protein GTQ43_40540 [Nostoc sp. KVJ3]|nr:hypothetical protein [Nostoc sp. KVJ3]
MARIRTLTVLRRLRDDGHRKAIVLLFLYDAELLQNEGSVPFINLKDADFSNIKLMKANLTGANLTRADLVGADLIGVDLTGANLTGANLLGADLIGADLIGADLTGANLTGAKLLGADLTGADLTGADLMNANLIGAKYTNEDIEQNVYSQLNLKSPPITKFPPDFDPKVANMKLIKNVNDLSPFATFRKQ